jgi:hypothetical protein
MAFRILVNKWRINKHPLQVKLKNIKKYFDVLQYYIIIALMKAKIIPITKLLI